MTISEIAPGLINVPDSKPRSEAQRVMVPEVGALKSALAVPLMGPLDWFWQPSPLFESTSVSVVCAWAGSTTDSTTGGTHTPFVIRWFETTLPPIVN